MPAQKGFPAWDGIHPHVIPQNMDLLGMLALHVGKKCPFGRAKGYTCCHPAVEGDRHIQAVCTHAEMAQSLKCCLAEEYTVSHLYNERIRLSVLWDT